MKRFAFLLIAVLLPALLALAQYTPRVLWDRSGAGPHSYYGGNVYALGDQNDDGFADWMVCAYGDTVGTPSEAVIELFRGGNPPSATPYWIFRADPDTALQVWDARPVGDLNGDGHIDWMVETEYRNLLPLMTGEIWWGGSIPVKDSLLIFTYDWSDVIFEGEGDINCDGYDDLCFNNIETMTARYLFGSPRPDTIVDWQMGSPAGHRYLANPLSTGDFNGDGRADYVSESIPPENILNLVLGANPPDSVADLLCPDYTEYQATILPDLNGDGFDDILSFGGGNNQARVRLGSTAPSCTVQRLLPFPVCDGGLTRFVGLEDINHDGYNDFGLIGWGCHSGWGEIDVFLGGNPLFAQPVFTISGRTAPLNLIGISVAVGLGDVNGDSVADFILGAHNTDFDGKRGQAVILSGDTDLVAGIPPSTPLVPTAFAFTLYPNPTNAAVTLTIDAGPGEPDADLMVYNLLGQVVRQQTVSLGSGLTRLSLNLSELSSGLYLVQLNRASSWARQKLMILK